MPESHFLVTPEDAYHQTDNNCGAIHCMTRQLDATVNIYNHGVCLCSITVIYNQQYNHDLLMRYTAVMCTLMYVDVACFLLSLVCYCLRSEAWAQL